MFQVLIAEPDEKLGQDLERLVIDLGYRAALCKNCESSLAQLNSKTPDLVLVSADLPPSGGLEFLSRLKKEKLHLPVILTSARGASEDIIKAIKLGAFDYVSLPFDPENLSSLVRQALKTGRLLNAPVAIESSEEHEIHLGDALLGRSRPMQELYKLIGRAAATDSTVLIQGESGTGKELVARALFQHSARADKPFVVVNCVAIPETLLESELFGYEKGAFTGADSRRIGKIEQANGGTIFLDEIGDMPLAIQAKILRLLQERSVERIGGRQPLAVDVRIIAATNRDLAQAVVEGRFREDLYYRLNVVPISLPPLRERYEDVPLLADYFLARVTRELGVRNPGITQGAYELLMSHSWPGNVRELANAMEKCLVIGQGQPISPEEVLSLVMEKESGPKDLKADMDQDLRSWVRQGIAVGQRKLLAGIMDRVEEIVLTEALDVTEGNRSAAARLLGISRPSLLSRLKKHGIN